MSGYPWPTRSNVSRKNRHPSRTFDLSMQVTRFFPSDGAPRPRDREVSNALRITRSDPFRVITRVSIATSVSSARLSRPRAGV